MGDGRYYTFYQFFSVILLVMLLMVVISSVFIGYYRNEKNNQLKQLIFMDVTLFVIILFKTIEMIIPSVQIGYIIRSFNAMTLILLIMIWLGFLNDQVFKIIKLKRRPVFYILVVVMVLIEVISKGHMMILSYLFFNTQFSTIYLMLLLCISVIVFIICVVMFKVKEQVHKIYKNYTLSYILIICLFLPLIVYSLMIIFKTNYLDFAEIFIFCTLSIMFNLSMFSQSTSGLTLLAFDKIGDIIDDYVFVTDLEGKLIYKNKRATESECFTKNEKININNMRSIYKIPPIIEKNTDGNEYAKIKCDHSVLYFSHKHDVLKNKGEVIGHIITIIDITNLMNLLYSLKEQKQKSIILYSKQKKYAEIVYYVEKEKEINLLLDEVISSREKEMENLIDRINELIDNDNDFEERINYVIKFNQRILEDVRKDVSLYRQHD